MRASRYMIFLYIAMIGTPILFILRLFAAAYYPVYTFMLTVLIGLGLLIFGALGFVEVFVHKGNSNALKVVQGGSHMGKEGALKKGARYVTFRIRRFNSQEKALKEESYRHSADKFTTVLDSLICIKSTQDQTLAMRYSCRMGICGSCGMVVNGKPVLACETNVLENAKNDEITIEPMLGHPLLKDLVTDFDDFFEKHMSVNPGLYRSDPKEKYKAKKEYAQTREQIDKFLPYSYCIMCGLCLDACPVINTNPEFVGPQALAQAYRYYSDSRDQNRLKRLLETDTIDGVWGCEFAGACSKVCPKGVDPAAAIQMLKSDLMAKVLTDEKKEE